MQGNFQEYAGLYEKRMINDTDGKILYLAISPIAKADTSLPIWDVRKMEYDGNGFLSWYRLPDNGIGFKYVFDDIATYFS